MHRKVEALRPLLRGVVLAAIVLAGADLLLLALRHWPGLSLPTLFDDGYFSVAISVLLLAIVLVLARRLARALDRAESAARLQQQVLDALEAGLVLFDANRSHRLLQPTFPAPIWKPGRGRVARRHL